MNLSSKSGRRFYFISGIIFLFYSILITYSTISTGTFFVGHELIFIGMTVMCFCLSYLFPQFKENDERAKTIREKGIYLGYFFTLGYMVILMLLFQFQLLELNGYQTVCLLATSVIITVFISFVVLSKRY